MRWLDSTKCFVPRSTVAPLDLKDGTLQEEILTFQLKCNLEG